MNDAMVKLQVVRALGWSSYKRQVHNAYRDFRECCSAKGIEFWKPIADDDRRRILAFKQYTEKIGLPYAESLAIVLDYWRQKVPSKRAHGLPVIIAALTGSISRVILRDYVEREYPDGENLTTIRFMRREATLNVGERVIGERQHASETMSFAAEAAEKREARETAVERLKENLRAYRGNPWR